MASTWVFLRHGQCQGNVGRLLVAPEDSPLTAAGWAQVRDAAAVLASFGIERIVSSPTLRARQTAAAVLERCPACHLVVLDALRERSFGPMDRWPIEQVRSSAWASTRTAWQHAPPDGETLAGVADRAIGALASLDPAGPTLVVTHAGVIRSVVGLLDGAPPDRIGCMKVPFAVPWRRRVPEERWAQLGR